MQTWMLVGSIILIFSGILFYTGFEFPFPLSTGGFSTLSISKIDFAKNVLGIPFSSVWSISALVSGTGQSYVAGASTPNTQLISSSGKKSQDSVKISISDFKQICRYGTTRTETFSPIQLKINTLGQVQYDFVPMTYPKIGGVGTTKAKMLTINELRLEDPIGTLNLQTSDLITSCINTVSNKPYGQFVVDTSNTGDIISEIISGGRPFGCIRPQVYTPADYIYVATPNQPRVETDIQMSITKNQQETEILKFTNTDRNQRSTASSVHVVGTYEADTINPSDPCPSGSFIIKINKNTNKLIDVYESATYNTNYNINNVLPLPESTTLSSYLSVLSNINRKQFARIDNPDASELLYQVVVDATSGGLIINRTINPLRYPLFTINIDSAWIRIFEPQAKPQIVANIQNCRYKELAAGKQVTFSVRNSGDTGGVETSIKCEPGTVSTGYFKNTISAGELISYSTTINGVDGIQVCIISASSISSNPAQMPNSAIPYQFSCVVSKACQDVFLPSNYVQSATTCEVKCGLTGQIVPSGYELKDDGATSQTGCYFRQIIKPTDCNQQAHSHLVGDRCICDSGYNEAYDATTAKLYCSPQSTENCNLVEQIDKARGFTNANWEIYPSCQWTCKDSQAIRNDEKRICEFFIDWNLVVIVGGILVLGVLIYMVGFQYQRRRR